jgi:hypothetical protein
MTSATSQRTSRTSPVHRNTRLALAALTALAAGCGAEPADSGPASAEPAAAEQARTAPGINLLRPASSPGVGVQVIVNHAPLIAGVGGTQAFLPSASGQLTVRAELRVEATDQDGDDLHYAWSAPGCAGAVITFPDPADQTRIELTSPGDAGCRVEVEVTDLWPGGSAPAATGLPPERGGRSLGAVQLSRAPVVLVGR